MPVTTVGDLDIVWEEAGSGPPVVLIAVVFIAEVPVTVRAVRFVAPPTMPLRMPLPVRVSA